MSAFSRRIGLPVLLSLVTILAAISPSALRAQVGDPAEETISLHRGAPTHPFPHYWEQMFGSGRAVLSLRDSYRRDLRAVRDATGFSYIRFHGIFLDEVGLYDEDANGNPVYNFSYVDQIYDGLQENHIRPFVELSFMPQKLAAAPTYQAFWYKPIVAPPKDWNKWNDLISHFAHHLIDRYGIDEVSQWYFEVWNEPNLDFWAGEPKQETYFQLYDGTARALKQVDPRLRVGGPSTAQAAWIDRFIQHVTENNVPVDFVSSHVYANDSSEDVFGTHETIPRSDMVCRAVRKVHDQVQASARKDLPLIWSEYNASYKNEPEVTDAEFMGPWLANTIRQCDGIVSIMSYWAFSDVFEEQGVVKQPFYGGYGLVAEDGIPKPAFNAFKLLHLLGTMRMDIDSSSAMATVRPDGTIVMAVWNLLPPGETGKDKRISIALDAGYKPRRVLLYRMDAMHGSVLGTYAAMGKPPYPTQAQIKALQTAAAVPQPETLRARNGKITITIPAHGLAVLEIH